MLTDGEANDPSLVDLLDGHATNLPEVPPNACEQTAEDDPRREDHFTERMMCPGAEELVRRPPAEEEFCCSSAARNQCRDDKEALDQNGEENAVVIRFHDADRLGWIRLRERAA